LNPQKAHSTPVQNGQGRWRPGHGKVVKIVHRKARSIINSSSAKA
jgi:hypothetical protein